MKNSRILEAVSDGLFSVNYTVFENEEQIAKIQQKMFSMNLRGTIEVKNSKFEVHKEGFISVVFFMKDNLGENVVVAEKDNFLGTRHIVKYAGQELEIKTTFFSLKEKYTIHANDVQIGTVGLKKLFSRTVVIEIEDWVREEVIVFLLWLTVLFISINSSSSSTSD